MEVNGRSMRINGDTGIALGLGSLRFGMVKGGQERTKGQSDLSKGVYSVGWGVEKNLKIFKIFQKNKK